MKVVEVVNLRKVYTVPVKTEGRFSSIRHFFARKYQDIVAVDGVTFSLSEGEMVGFIGPNGAGKTTTLKMLTGLIAPTSGEVRVLGYDPFKRQKEFLKSITLVMGQKQQLIWDLPAIDSLRINKVVYGLEDDVFEERLKVLGEMLDILGVLHKPVRKLSLGERMKAELLAALIHNPRILFLDEPTIGLDVSAQVAIREFLKEYNERFNATILMTSHYMADIEELCDRVILIHSGRIVFDGDLYDLVEKVTPYKEIIVELKRGVPLGVLRGIGEIREVDGNEVKFIVKRDEVFEKIKLVLEALPVDDFSVQDPPIEEVIRRVFGE